MKISESTFTSIGILTAIAAGIIFPIHFSVTIILPVLLSILLFGSFLSIEVNFSLFFRRELLYFPLYSFIVLPCITAFVTVSLPTDFRIGLVIMALTPIAIASPIVVSFIHGDRELSVAQVIVSNLLSPFAYSAGLLILFKTQNIDVPVMKILTDIGLIITIPFIVSRFVRFHKKTFRLSSRILKKITPYGFVMLIYFAVAASSSRLFEFGFYKLAAVFAITLLMAMVNYIFGFFLSSKKKIKRSLSVGLGHRNTTLAIWVALSNYGSVVAIPMIMYMVCHHVINGFLVYLFRSKKQIDNALPIE